MGEKEQSFKDFYEKHQVWLNLVFVVIVAILICCASVVFMNKWTNHGMTEIVPKVIGLRYENAKNVLLAQGFKVEADSIYDKMAIPGGVLDQSPKENESVKHGRTVYLKINSFYPEMKVVNSERLLHISSMQAQNLLQAMGFTRIKIKEVVGDNDDEVIEVNYKGRRLDSSMKIPISAELVLVVTFNPNKDTEIDTLSVDYANNMIQDSLLIIDNDEI